MQKRTLLIPLDGSQLSKGILNEVRHLFSAQQNRLTLLQIVPSTSAGSFNQDLETAKADLKIYEKDLLMDGYDVETILVTGHPADEIVHAAERERADMVAMTTQDLDPVHPLFVGDTARDVLERVRVPVLLLNPDPRDSVMPALQPTREHSASAHKAKPLLAA